MEWTEIRKSVKVARFVNDENSDEYKFEYMNNKIRITFNGEFINVANGRVQAERFMQNHIYRHK